jgi:hypothetical protein
MTDAGPIPEILRLKTRQQTMPKLTAMFIVMDHHRQTTQTCCNNICKQSVTVQYSKPNTFNLHSSLRQYFILLWLVLVTMHHNSTQTDNQFLEHKQFYVLMAVDINATVFCNVTLYAGK